MAQHFELDFFRGPVVQILVRSTTNPVHNECRYHIHQLALQKHTPYFREPRLTEGAAVFDNMCPTAFYLFTCWVYCGDRTWQRYDDGSLSGLYEGTLHVRPSSTNIETLIRAFHIGQQLSAPKFKDFILTQVREVYRNWTTASTEDLDLAQNLGFGYESDIVLCIAGAMLPTDEERNVIDYSEHDEIDYSDT